jgi:HAD domain in Swiss Army Knife RNA repair proteins
MKKVIVIFLDIDGVLLPFPFPFHTSTSTGTSTDDDTVNDGESDKDYIMFGCFPNSTLQALSTILEAFFSADDYDIRIVLSSTWRVSKPAYDEIIDSFHQYKKSSCSNNENDTKINPLNKIDDFYSTTNVCIHTARQHEIYKWLEEEKERQMEQQYSIYNSNNNNVIQNYDATTTASDNNNNSNNNCNNYKIDAWIALDDEELIHGDVNASYRSYFEGHVIQTSSLVGLTNFDAIEAIRLLHNQLLP